MKNKKESISLCDWRYQAIRACNALDKIYNSGDYGVYMVLKHYGPHHSKSFKEWTEKNKKITLPRKRS